MSASAMLAVILHDQSVAVVQNFVDEIEDIFLHEIDAENENDRHDDHEGK
jgi:hypothetical protein